MLSVFSYEDEPGWRWALLGGLLGLKVLVAAAALAVAWRRGHITWRFPAALCVVCGAVLCFVLFALPLWRAGTRFEALTAILLVPLARPALCPLALAANRHR
ncbi:MAG: hypothetical protein EG825_18355 [Rhodocyclaceae bacterium]|nr:hypothetical protein [Rhodocyclaceae bacterium]